MFSLLAQITAASESTSIWSDVTPWEIAMFAAGGLLTIGLLGFFVWLALRAGREGRESRKPG